MLLSNATLLCQIALLNSISYLHISRDAAYDAFAEVVSELLSSCDGGFIVRTGECFEDPPVWPSDRLQVMLFARSPAFYQLETLQVTCYPAAGVWCALSDAPPSASPRQEWLEPCDVFVLSDEPMLLPKHVIRNVSGLTVFTLTPPEQVCNKAGIPDPSGRFRAGFNGLRLVNVRPHVTNNSLYTGDEVPAKSISPFYSGKVQGFEQALFSDIAQRLNFSMSHTDLGFEYRMGPRPMRHSYWDRTVLGYVMFRKAHTCFGDLSIIHPREVYFELSYTHDVDVATFLAKVDVPLYSGGQLLDLIGVPVSVSYIVCVMTYSLWFTVDRVHLPRSKNRAVVFEWLRKASFVYVYMFVYFASYIVRPNNSVKFSLKSSSAFLTVTWRLSMFWLSTTFGSVLTSFITNPSIQGKCHTLVDVLHVLRTVARSRVFTLPGFKQIFDAMMEGRYQSSVISGISQYMETYSAEADVFDAWRRSRVAFVFGESLVLRRDVWAHNMGDYTFQTSESTYSAYQTIAFQKGCILRDQMSALLQRYVETGHVSKYKRLGGIHLANKINVPLIERQLTLASFLSIFLFVGIGNGLCIVLLLMEILKRYEFITPTPPSRAYWDLLNTIQFARLEERPPLPPSEEAGLERTAEGHQCEIDVATQRNAPNSASNCSDGHCSSVETSTATNNGSPSASVQT